MSDFEPTIVAFFCNWCTYTAADLAGTSRLSYPPNIKIIRVMCSGMVDPQYIIKAFLEGADAVLVSGCHIGDCHYLKGNYMTPKRFQVLREALKFLGLEEGRLRLEWVSAAEGEKYAEVIRSFTEEVKALGPSPLRSRKAAKAEVEA